MQLNAAYQQEFEQMVRDFMAAYQAVGTAVGVVSQKGETVYRQFFGYRDLEKQLPLDENTIFGLASITKSFTALCIMQLVERGILDLYAPVNRYLPEFNYPNQNMPRLWHLLCHSAGYPPQPRLLLSKVAPTLDLPAEERQDLAYSATVAQAGIQLLLKQLSEVKTFLGQPGEYVSYSNDGFAMLSEIIRLYGGENSYAGYVEKHILAPLGMNRSTYSFSKPLQDENANTLYVPGKTGLRATHDWLDNQFVMMGGGSLKSTLADLERYVTMWLNHGRYAGGRLLSDTGIGEMQKQRQTYSHHVGYGFALQTFALDDITVIGHGGSLTGVSTAILWSDDLAMGVIVLCNTSGVPVMNLAKAMIKWCNQHNPKEPMTVFQHREWSQAQKQAACGSFVSGEGSVLTISLNAEQQLQVLLEGEALTLDTVLPDLALAQTKLVKSEIRFLRRADESVWAVGNGGRILMRQV
ncbi:MAG: beta-lactamase family protein [Negativicutes bacterium]|nr:beta-lactamase family protein [Negativicutes bacterium]